MARILVVDDESDMRMALGNVLSRMGHEVFEAGDGTSALEFLARDHADLMLLDIRMPGLDGVQILRKLRESDRKTPVIMVTGYGSVESAVEVMQLGASHYLAKPFSNHELKETVERVLQGRSAPQPARAAQGGAPLARPEPRLPAARAPAGAGPMVVRREPERAWLAPALAAGTAISVAGLWLLLGGPRGRVAQLPHDHPTALAWEGGRLWTADWVAQAVYELEPAGAGFRTLRSVPLPGAHVTGMALSKDRLYLCDSWRGVIEERRLDAGLSLVRSYRAPGPKPSGLFWDGRYLWSSDSARGRIYQHEPAAELAVLAEHAAPAKAPAALYKDADYFWSADAESRLLYQHRLDAKLSVLASYALPELDAGREHLSTFTWKDGRLWLARDGSKKLLVRALSSFDKKERRSRP